MAKEDKSSTVKGGDKHDDDYGIWQPQKREGHHNPSEGAVDDDPARTRTIIPVRRKREDNDKDKTRPRSR